MGDYLRVADGEIWWEEQGSGAPLVLLHGGAVDSRFFVHNVPALAERFRVITTDLWGHGRTADRDGPFTLASFANDVAELIAQVADGRAHVFGHSIGAAVALQLAKDHPARVDRLGLGSGGFRTDAEIGLEGMSMDDQVEQTVAFLGSTYGEVSPDGEEHFATVVRKDFELSEREPNYTEAQVATVTARTLVMAADDDITTLEHILELYRALPNAELSVVPGTSHFFLQEKPAACNAILLEFFGEDPVPTVAPIRRAAATERS